MYKAYGAASPCTLCSVDSEAQQGGRRDTYSCRQGLQPQTTSEILRQYVLDFDIIARMILSLLPVKNSLVLSIDRSNWKFGEFNINILMLGIIYKGIPFPLIFSLLPKRGNSNWQERRELLERFIRFFVQDRIDCLVADFEFIGKEWIGWLNNRRIGYYIRIRENQACESKFFRDKKRIMSNLSNV